MAGLCGKGFEEESEERQEWANIIKEALAVSQERRRISSVFIFRDS